MQAIILFFVLIFIFLCVCLILPWINRYKIKDLEYEIWMLKNQVKTLLHEPEEKKTVYTSSIQKESLSPDVQIQHIPMTPKSKINFEEQFGARLPVWIGGVALALAGIFMVKYSIDSGLLSPMIRVIMGFIFGTGLLYGADQIRKRPTFSNGIRISQALSGAGIAILYSCVFSASNLYDLIPLSLGFAGMAVVTTLAVVLSIRHGMPIALLGLVGGFLTPAIINSAAPSNPIIFVYLYCVVAGLMTVIRKQAWWWMGIPTVLGAFLWACVWIFFGSFSIFDTVYLGAFLIATSSTIIALSNQQYNQELEKTRFDITPILNYITFAGAFILAGVISHRAGFGPMEWGLFAILSLGCTGLAIFNQRLYGLAPWLSMIQSIIMLILWNHFDVEIL